MEVVMFDRYEEKPAFTVTGQSIETTHIEGAAFETIPQFWAQCHRDGTTKELDALAPDTPFLGVCYGMQPSGVFHYMIAKETGATTPHESLHIPAATWAVFVSVGPMPGAIQAVWQDDVVRFLSRPDITYADLPDLEVYPCGDNKASNYRAEVWVAVRQSE
ncbi:MAG: AraC family transcriptional regulator [Acholeplasmatales bacterium]|nr:MAG: AraC family transcriptional regulator [Acholeplasmatales bacterium]